MGLTITRATGSLNRVNPSEDAVFCLVMTGTAVSGKIALGEPKQLFSITALDTLGITTGNNPLAHKDITDFYSKAGEGAELWIMLVSDATSLTDICNKANNNAKKLIDATDGRAVMVFVNNKAAAGFTPTIEDGFDASVWAALTKANELCADYDAQNIPICAVLPGFKFTSADIADIPARSTLNNDYVAINCFCKDNDGLVSQGMLAGWLAKHQVHENIGRVASGKVSDTAFFPDGTTYLSLKSGIELLAGKGLIVPVKRGQRSGFYYYDDPTMTAVSSDYSSISWNRVINKAKRIAADILLDKLNESVETNVNDGKIESSVCSDWESDVETAIKTLMMKETPTKKKEISGIKCFVDPESDIVNDEINATISVVRKGQAKTIAVTIRYTATI